MEGLNFQSNKIIAASFDKNSNGFVEELNATDDVKKLLDKEGDGISVKELATGLAHDLVVVDGDSIKKGSLGKVPVLREAETLKSIDATLTNALLQSMTAKNTSTQSAYDILKSALMATRQMADNTDHSIYVIADNALMNATIQANSSTSTAYEILKDAAQSITRITSSVSLETSLKAVDKSISSAFSTVQGIEEKQKQGKPVVVIQKKLLEKADEEKQNARVVLKSIAYGAGIGAVSTAGVTAIVRAAQGTLLTPKLQFIPIQAGVLRVKPLVIAASIGLAAGVAVGAITGAVIRGKHLDKAENYEKTANRIELYDPALTEKVVVDKAGELYTVAKKAVNVENLLDAKYVEQSAGKIKKEVDDVNDEAKNILNAYKLSEK